MDHPDSLRLPATAQSVVEVFGPLDDATIAEILAIGATRADLVEARAWIDAGDVMGETRQAAPRLVVERICEIVESTELEPDER